MPTASAHPHPCDDAACGTCAVDLVSTEDCHTVAGNVSLIHSCLQQMQRRNFQHEGQPDEARDSLAEGAGREELSDEVDAHRLRVQPRLVKAHDVLVLQLLQYADFSKQTIAFLLAVDQLHHANLLCGSTCGP
jgi:hypothetical protein